MHPWAWLVPATENGVPTTLVICLAAATLISWESFRQAFQWLVAESQLSGIRWLLVHLLAVAALLGWAALYPPDRALPSPYWEIWIWLRVTLELSALASWALAALPPSFWLRWFAASPGSFATRALFAIGAKLLGHYTEALWSLLQSSTFRVVAALLGLLGQPVITVPAKARIGVPTFSVEIAGSCSGLEGLGVVLAFLAIYFWVYRRDLRFP